jgi:spermidine/putrescine transport system substrate-binding protein
MTNDPGRTLNAIISRRRLLQLSAVTGVGAFLAACGAAGTKTAAPAVTTGPVVTTGPAATTAATAAGTPGVTATPGSATTPPATEAPTPTSAAAATPVIGVFKMATWIGYIDLAADGVTHPSLDRFTQETGIQVDYQEAVDDNESFFAAQLKAPLQSGVDTGWDLVVLTDWMIIRLITLGWLEKIAPSANFPTNLGDIYKTREWDQGNVYAAPWQSGMTGIGFDKKKTGEVTNLDVLFDVKYAGKMTYLTEMRDTVGLAALDLGSDPTNLTQPQFDAAVAKITKAVKDAVVRQLTGNSYVEDMAAGGVIVAMAWSGDVAGLLVPDQKASQDFQWRLADQGGMLWTDNMAIPKGARNKAQAEVFINWYYLPANAAEVEAYVNYVCPVKGAETEIVKLDPALGANVLIFPTADMQARLHQFVALDIKTAAAWESAFATAIGQ